MDQITHHPQLIKKYISNFANLMNSQPVPGLETAVIFDDEHKQYLLLKTGWHNQQRKHHIILHVAIKNNQISIEEDWTEGGIATFLLEQGVPYEKIILSFQPPEIRPHTKFSVA